MLTTDFDSLRLPRATTRHRAARRLWREWCFLRSALAHFRGRILLLVVLLLGGALLFRVCEPEKQHSFTRAVYCTWALVFGEPPEEFPTSPVLQALFFLVPLIGLVVIIEAIVDFALMLRDRRRNERSWCKVMAAALTNHIIVVGLGKLGYRIFRLLQRLGEPVVVIERNAGNQFLEELRREGTPLIIGDARREALLVEANAARAKSIILATNDDLANLETALDARQINPQIRVVLRLFDQNMADKIRAGFNMQIAMSQSAISAPTFVMAALEGSIVASMIVGDELIITQRWFVHRGGPLCGKTVAAVMSEFGVVVLERWPRGGTTALMPPPDTRLDDGDKLLVQGTFERLSRLRQQTPALHAQAQLD